MTDFAMCHISLAEDHGHPSCPRKNTCRRNPLSRASPHWEWQTWADWWTTWEGGDPMTCEGYLPIEDATEETNDVRQKDR